MFLNISEYMKYSQVYYMHTYNTSHSYDYTHKILSPFPLLLTFSMVFLDVEKDSGVYGRKMLMSQSPHAE